MAAAVQITSVDAAGQNIYITFTVVPSGNYPVGGDVLNFAAAVADPSYVGLLPQAMSSNLLQCDLWSQGGNLGRTYTAIITKTGTPATVNPATGVKMKVNSAQGTFGSEHSASAYDADILADVITGWALFTKLL